MANLSIMTSSRDDNIIELLNYISEQLNKFLPIIILIFGGVGNILNCLVLSQRTLRTNICAFLFLVSSCIGLISIMIGVPTRILAGWDLDPTATINWICKFRAFMVFSTRSMALWLITLATIDRWLLSYIDIHHRRMSTLKNAYWAIIITVIFSIACYSHMLYCYEANITNAPLQCYGKIQECRWATDLVYGLLTITIPLILMITFGLMTISNLHHAHVRVENAAIPPIAHPEKRKQQELKRTDHHLLRMLLVQILCSIILCVPQALQKFFISIKPFGSEDELYDTIATFLYNIEILLAFVASSMPFYIYTLAGGNIFRKALMDLMRNIIQKMTCKSS